MFLSDVTLKKILEDGSLQIAPHPANKDIRPNSIRVHLGSKLIKYDENQTIDPTKEVDAKHHEIDLEKESYTLSPGEFVLGSTKEAIRTPRNIFGFLDGRSTLARLGITIHITAAITDSLYEDQRTITLEIHNAGNMNIVLSKDMPIGALLFTELDQEVAQETQSQYKGQTGPVASNLKSQYR